MCDALVICVATISDRGVSTTTSSAILMLMVSMKASVPATVTSPLKSCAKPCKSPSDTISMSGTTRAMRSPRALPSI